MLVAVDPCGVEMAIQHFLLRLDGFAFGFGQATQPPVLSSLRGFSIAHLGFTHASKIDDLAHTVMVPRIASGDE